MGKNAQPLRRKPLNRTHRMKPSPLHRALVPVVATLLLLPLSAEEKPEATPLKCHYSGVAAKPEFNLDYEGTTYGFCSAENRAQFEQERAASLYQRIGGQAALTAAVDLFYVKVLADERVSHFFEDINMKAQVRKQKEFLAHVLGAPTAWTGKDMRKAHENLDLREADFQAIAENLQATLSELKLDEKLIGEIMTIVASTKKDVLNQ